MTRKLLKVAEGMGFEPTIRHYPYNGLANLRPREAIPAETKHFGRFSYGENRELRELVAVSCRHTTRHSFIVEGHEFYCHEPAREGALCSGWAMFMLAKNDASDFGEVPWDFIGGVDQ